MRASSAETFRAYAYAIRKMRSQNIRLGCYLPPAMNHTELASRWTALWKQIGAIGDPSPIYQQLIAAYSEQHRFYHNLTHLRECLMALDASGTEPTAARIVETALWFHDAVYDPRASDNEERSAELAGRSLRDGKVPAEVVDRVRRLILATKTHESDGQAEQALMLDVDLSILGSEPIRFSEYERQIRQEYSWVPLEVFVPKRIEILEKFLNRPRVFHLPWFYDRLESRTRSNLKNSLTLLKAQ